MLHLNETCQPDTESKEHTKQLAEQTIDKYLKALAAILPQALHDVLTTPLSKWTPGTMNDATGCRCLVGIAENWRGSCGRSLGPLYPHHLVGDTTWAFDFLCELQGLEDTVIYVKGMSAQYLEAEVPLGNATS